MSSALKDAAKIATLVAIATLLSGPATAEDSLDETFKREVLIIEASEHACYRFDIYMAFNTAQQRRGLMHVRQLPQFSGMLFVYSEPGIRSMWMKNTYIPLDMLFIRGDGTVSSVAANTEPLSLESVRSKEPVNFVLELNAGVSKKLRIDADSKLIFDQPGT